MQIVESLDKVGIDLGILARATFLGININALDAGCCFDDDSVDADLASYLARLIRLKALSIRTLSISMPKIEFGEYISAIFMVTRPSLHPTSSTLVACKEIQNYLD